MATLKQRLAATCVCGHQGAAHQQRDAGTHVELNQCGAAGCGCPQFRRSAAVSERAGKTSRAHSEYPERGYRL